jgi:AcrR family transcriptional regulator
MIYNVNLPKCETEASFRSFLLRCFGNFRPPIPYYLTFCDAASKIDGMVELTRKQREIERRASEILRVSKPILVREGVHALSMDRVASDMEYAKGTIYNHFPHKEEIVLALALESMELRRKLFEHAAQYPSTTRTRMMAIGSACEFYTQHCHDDFVIEQSMRNAHVWDKSTQQRQDVIRQCEADCMSIVASLVHDGIESQDLVSSESLPPEEMVFGLWAINFGSQILMASSPSLSALGIHNPLRAIRVHCCTLLNGFGWQPIIAIEDHLLAVEHMTSELFPQFHAIRSKHFEQES